MIWTYADHSYLETQSYGNTREAAVDKAPKLKMKTSMRTPIKTQILYAGFRNQNNQPTYKHLLCRGKHAIHACGSWSIYIYIYRIHMYANRVTIMFHVNRKPAKFPMLQNIKHLFDDGPMKTSETRVICG